MDSRPQALHSTAAHAVVAGGRQCDCGPGSGGQHTDKAVRKRCHEVGWTAPHQVVHGGASSARVAFVGKLRRMEGVDQSWGALSVHVTVGHGSVVFAQGEFDLNLDGCIQRKCGDADGGARMGRAKELPKEF